MPYINKSDRPNYTKVLEELSYMIPKDRMLRPGHMNYVISKLIELVYGKDIRYADHNEVCGLLSCVKDEFYRRKTAPYEDIKIEQEGDI